MRQPGVWRRRLLPIVMAVPALVAARGATAQEEERVSLRATATVLLNAFWTSRATNNFDLPQFVTPLSASDSLGDGGGMSMTLRQTRVGVQAFWPDLGGAEARAEIDADFYGGQQGSQFGRLFPLLRIRRAFAELAWTRARLLVGQEVPLIAEYNPSSLATIGLSGLSGSGNLWLWLPQVRGSLTVTRGKAARLDLDAALLAPSNNEAVGELLTQPDRAERSERPYVQARAVLRWGSDDHPGDVSVGGHAGWFATAGDTLLSSRAVAVATRVPLGMLARITAEWFGGRALAGLGGGGIGQSFGEGGVPVRTTGGWGQLVVTPRPSLELSVGYGYDDPDDADLGPGARLRNATASAGVRWTPGPLLLGLEYRAIRTRYGDRTLGARHVNLAFGLGF